MRYRISRTGLLVPVTDSLWIPSRAPAIIIDPKRCPPLPDVGRIPPLECAVAFDAAWNSGANSQGSPFTSSTGTIGSNSNRIALVFLQTRGFLPTVSSMTLGGETCTQIVAPTTPGQVTGALYGIINPTAGASKSATVTFTGGPGTVLLGIVILYNADQSTGWQNSGTDSGTGTTASSVVTSANGNMAVAGHANNNASSTSLSAGTENYLNTSLDGNYGSGRVASTGSSSTITWSLGSSVLWINVKVDVIAVSAGGRTTKNTRAFTLGAEAGMNWRGNLGE